jgi:hypothetical protein
MQINFTKKDETILKSTPRCTMSTDVITSPTEAETVTATGENNDKIELRTIIGTKNGFTSRKNKNTISKLNTVYIFDIEEETGVEMDSNIKILKDLEGLSQLNFNNNLYLCGAGMKNDTSGSYLLKCDPVKVGNYPNILINSIHHHYYPTLLGYRGDLIVAIGGYQNKHSEIYNIKTNKWRNLPDLPEERYCCSVINDEVSDFVYLFGGVNSETGKNCSTILRLNMKNTLVWETLIVKANAHLIARNSAAILKFDRSNVIYILGGKENDENLSDNIVEYDLNSRIASVSRKRLEMKSAFFQQTGADLNKSDFFIYDENSNIHKISKNDFKINILEFKTVFEDNDN